jgi:hypothetical protein
MNTSKVLNVSKKDLAEVKEAELSTIVKDYYFGVNYVIVPPKGSIESQLIIPQPMKLEA